MTAITKFNLDIRQKDEVFFGEEEPQRSDVMLCDSEALRAEFAVHNLTLILAEKDEVFFSEEEPQRSDVTLCDSEALKAEFAATQLNLDSR